MAVNIGPRIGIDGESEYRKQINQIIQSTKTLQAEMKALTASFDSNAKAQDVAKAKSQNLVQQIDAQKKHIEQCADMVRKSSEMYGENDQRVLKWKQALAEGEVQLESLYKELRNNSPIMALSESLEEAGTKLKSVGDSMQNVGKTLTTHLTVPIMAVGTASAKLAMDFQAGMSKVAAISGATGDELTQLTEKAREMGAKTKFSATESAEAFSYMAMAGWKAADMLDGIEGVMNLAAASGEDLALVSDIVTDDLTAFGLAAKDTSRFVDVLAAASSNSNTNVAMMGETFQYVGSVAGAMGYSIEDVALATGLMANAGVKASNSGTALRSVITRMAKPTKESAIAMENLGLEITNADGSMRPLYDVIVDMRKGFAGMTEAEKASNAAMLAGKNAMSGLLAVVNATDEDFDKLTEAIRHSNGAAKLMAEIMENNAKGSITRMKSALEGAGIALGDVLIPYITKGAESVQKLAEQFSALSPKTQENIVKWAALAAAIGPVVTIGGKLVSTAGELTTGLSNIVKKIAEAVTSEQLYAIATGEATAAQTALNIAMDANPIGLVAVALAGAAAAGLALKAVIGDVEEETNKTADTFKELTDGVDSASDSLSTGMHTIRGSIDEAGDSAEGTARQARDLIDELTGLEKQSNKTAAQEQRMTFIVDQLNTLYPNLGLEVDALSGKLNKGSEELRNYVDNMKQVAMADAYFNAMSAGYAQVAESERELTKAEKEYQTLVNAGSNLLAAQNLALKNYYDAMEKGTAVGLEFNGVLYDFDTGLEKFRTALEENSQAQDTAKEKIESLKEEVTAASEEVDDYSLAYENATAKAQEYATAADEAAASTNALTGTVEEGVRSFDDLSYAQQQTAIAFADQVNQLTQSNVEAIQSQMNMFEEFKKGSDVSTETLLKNMQSQIDGIHEWEENLTSLADRGINQNLLGYLSGMGPQGEAYVRAFKNMTDEEFKQANELWEQSLDVAAMTDKWGQELLDSGVENISKAFDGIDQVVRDAGENTARGLAEGIIAEAYSSKEAAEDMGFEVIDAVNIALGVHSPSYKTRQSGMYLDQGLAQGMRDGMKEIQTAAKQVMDLVQSTLVNALTGVKAEIRMQGQQTAIALSQGIKAGDYYVESAAKNTGKLVENIYFAAMAVVTQIETGGENVVKGLELGITSRQFQVEKVSREAGDQVKLIGQTANRYYSDAYAAGNHVAAGLADGIKAGQSEVIKAAKAVAQAAIKETKSELGIHSPSKVFYEIGDYTIQGYVDALMSGRSDIRGALNGAFNAPIAAFPNAVSGGSGAASQNVNYEGNTVIVYGAPGQDVEELADIIENRLNFKIQAQNAVIA